MSVADAEPSPESCSTKANPTTPPRETSLEDHGLEYRQSKWDWTLPGLGEPGPDCGADRLPEADVVCPNGDSVRYEPLKCRRLECPDCYRGEQVERAFRMALEIEARARVQDERPHAVVCSVPPSDARTWTYERLNTALFRRGYRRMRRKCSIDGGFAVFHPWRIQEPRKRALRRRGYGSGGDRGGLWAGVRDDALELGDAREYVKFGPHVHQFGIGPIEPHEGDDYVIQKYADLEDVEDVVRHARYVLSHRGDRTGETGRSVRPWGAFHHATDDWRSAEDELEAAEYRRLAEDIASRLGMDWTPEDGLTFEDSEECPECGTSTSEFLDMGEMYGEVKGSSMGEPWHNRLESDRRRFFEQLADDWMTMLAGDDATALYLDDLDPPDSVRLWSSARS